MPDLRCDETTERCVYENPTTGKCSLDGPPSDVSVVIFLVAMINSRKCDPSVKSRPEDYDESTTEMYPQSLQGNP